VTGLDARVAVRLGTLDLDAHLQVAPGETVAVLGPNGAGKTTLLRAIAGLFPIDRGAIAVDGVTLDDTRTYVEPEHRPVALMFQDHLLFPHLSVVDNVAFGLRATGMRRKDAARQATAWLERVGLGVGVAAHTRPAQLSGGQAQRVALARALATSPRVLLLDEPLAALDAASRGTTRRDLARHLRTHDGMRVVVTHDPVEAAALADRLVVLEAGRVVQTGTIDELTARPRSRYVADLVGVNLVTGRATDGTVTVDGTAITLTVADAAPDGDVVAVVHPRAVALHRRAPDGTPRNVWPATVESVDAEGTRARVRIRLAPHLLLVAEVTTAAVADLAIAEGATVWASVKATEIAVFAA
jgi:molybdate transport system ATP-binding protein